jgi:hypothetical protein
MNQIETRPHRTPFLLTAEELNVPWSNFRLRSGAEVFTVSAPLPGDATLSAKATEDSEWVTLGVAALALPRLSAVLGQTAVLFTDAGRRVCELTLEKTDARFNVVVGRLGPMAGRAASGSNRRAA